MHNHHTREPSNFFFFLIHAHSFNWNRVVFIPFIAFSCIFIQGWDLFHFYFLFLKFFSTSCTSFAYESSSCRNESLISFSFILFFKEKNNSTNPNKGFQDPQKTNAPFLCSYYCVEYCLVAAIFFFWCCCCCCRPGPSARLHTPAI